MDNIYNEEVISKYDYKPILTISQEEGDFETNLKLNFFQRESFYYFANLFAKKPFFRFFESHFEIKKNFFHDGVHFSLLGMKEIAKSVAEYIIQNKAKLSN